MTRIRKPSGRHPFGSGRKEISYRRHRGSRSPERVILILCEGSKTEPQYFRHFKAANRLRTIPIEVIPGGEDLTDPIRLLEAAKKARVDHDCDQEHDRVWCVFDAERKGTHDLERVIRYARGNRLLLAISNPAFEYWCLLHYECTDRLFVNALEVIAALRQHIPRYDKSMDIYQCLGERTAQALGNAGLLRKRGGQDWSGCPNPSTGVDQLVQEIWAQSPA